MNAHDDSPFDVILLAPFVALGRIGRSAPALMPLLYVTVTLWVWLTMP